MGKNEVRAVDREVDVRIRASAFVQSTNGALVVRVDQ